MRGLTLRDSAFVGLVGQSKLFEATVTTNSTNLNLRSFAVSNGWNESSEAIITIAAGVVISGDTPGNSTAALTIDGVWPGNVTLINNGVIVGRGGKGGDSTSGNGVAGEAGGTALQVSSSVSINNAGTIAGGGGGGGSGSASSILQGIDDSAPRLIYPGCGGGGGASSNVNAPGGSSATDSGGTSAPGGAGVYNSAGAGGTKSSHASGGNGGAWGSNGSSGQVGTFQFPIAGAGGAGGRAVNGNSNITWIATGTRLGSIV